MRRYQLHIILVFLIIFILACIYFAIGFAPARASLLYGSPASSLSISDRIEYSAKLLSYGDVLKTPLDPSGTEQSFSIAPGETVYSIANRLEESKLISDSQAFYDYAVYSGLDLTIQSGTYILSPALSIVDIARALQKFSPSDATLVILPGWRMEEIAASLPTSGLEISKEAFLSLSQTLPPALASISPLSMEGFFFPDSYTLPRSTTGEQLMDAIARNFMLHLTDDMRSGFTAQGLDVYQAVTLASIVERESVLKEEQALIASVFINRLNAGMTLGSDPTVQYALGYDSINQTWWTNPLSLDNLKFDSPYNTYIYSGLPPGPISSPGLDALKAVAFPETSPYYFFQAKCDGSGYHTFAVTFDEHLANRCP